MKAMPAELQADSGVDYLANQPLSMIDIVRRQQDRIAYLRSSGGDWGEAVMELRDQLVGLEDDEFWTGIDAAAAKRIKAAEDAGDDDLAQKLAQECAPRGWLGVPIRAYQAEDGSPIYKPTNAELSTMRRILNRLLHRKGMLWKTRHKAPLPPVEEP